MRRPLCCVLLSLGCDRSPAAEVDPERDRESTPEPPAETFPATTAWPDVPHGRTATGEVWQTVRHGTVHVHFAAREGTEVTKSSLELGHPVVRAKVGDSTIEITYSSGTAPFGPSLARDPPQLDTIPVQRIARTPENTTVQYLRQGEMRVLGWVRGAKCESTFLRTEDADAAFAFCSSVRVPPPARPERRASASGVPLPPIPADATLQEQYGVPILYTGHYIAKVVPGTCPSEAEIHDASTPDVMAFENRTYPNGPVLLGRRTATWDGETYPTTTSVWATRDAHCCVATIGEFFTEPTADQIDDIARLCDATARE